ncbi:MAG: hypothetical protein PHU86_04205 [Patescibacteria group bacterium]|nr:hypothetical protein [Patescibacteria group bacterium]
MKRKGYMVFFSTVLILTLSLLMGYQCIAFAADAKLVKIEPVPPLTRTPEGSIITHKATGLSIVPKVLEIDKNTIVIWLNGATEEVKVIFEEGKVCKDLVLNPKDFNLDERSCFVTTFMPWGATSSLVFPKPGKFAYSIETSGGKLKAKGEIIVRK